MKLLFFLVMLLFLLLIYLRDVVVVGAGVLLEVAGRLVVHSVRAAHGLLIIIGLGDNDDIYKIIN